MSRLANCVSVPQVTSALVSSLVSIDTKERLLRDSFIFVKVCTDSRAHLSVDRAKQHTRSGLIRRRGRPFLEAVGIV